MTQREGAPSATGRGYAVLATLDTKAEEAGFLLERFRRAGATAWLIDIGIRDAGAAGTDAAFSRRSVLAAAGSDQDELASLDKTEALQTMASGAGAVLRRLLAEGRLAGVLGIGGGQGTWLAATAMRTLPLGVPKAIVSTVIGRSPVHVRASDIVMIPSITDMSGLNRILVPVLARAVDMIVAAGSTEAPAPADRPLVGMTMFGVTTAGGTVVRRRLEDGGHETAVFHANGNGGRTLESLIAEGALTGVLDWTITELADELVGGIASAGPERLRAAAANRIPQVVVPGALDVVNFGAPDTVPERFRDRLLHAHTPESTLMRTSAEESARLGQLVAERLNRAAPGSVAVVIPTDGFSAVGAPGGPFHDPDADRAFADALRARADGYPVLDVAGNINDAGVAERAVDVFLDLLPSPMKPIKE